MYPFKRFFPFFKRYANYYLFYIFLRNLHYFTIQYTRGLWRALTTLASFAFLPHFLHFLEMCLSATSGLLLNFGILTLEVLVGGIVTHERF